MSRHFHSPALLSVAAAAVLALVPAMAQAQLTDKPVRMVNDVGQLLQLMGIGLFTCAVLWAAYKMIFEGARFHSISNIFWGGVLAGAAGTIANWAMGA